MLFELNTNQGSVEIEQNKYDPKIAQIQQTIKKAIGIIKQGCDYPFATGSLWSTHDLIEYIISQIGPAHLTFATWSISTAAADKLINWLNGNQIKSINALVDWRVQVRTPAILPLAQSNFSNIRVSSCHAKAFVLQNQNWDISFVGSANLTNNPRIECGHISTNKKVAEFHKTWIMEEIKNCKPFGMDMRKAKKDGRK